MRGQEEVICHVVSKSHFASGLACGRKRIRTECREVRAQCCDDEQKHDLEGNKSSCNPPLGHPHLPLLELLLLLFLGADLLLCIYFLLL